MGLFRDLYESRRDLVEEWRGNHQHLRIQIAILLLRFAQISRAHLGRRHPVALLLGSVYLLFSQTFGSFDIPVGTTIGTNLRIHHGYGIVINADAVLGNNVTLRHGVTIGNTGSKRDRAAPVVEDDVTFGAGATALGGITIGRGSLIGAHALVLTDIPESARVA